MSFLHVALGMPPQLQCVSAAPLKPSTTFNYTGEGDDLRVVLDRCKKAAAGGDVTIHYVHSLDVPHAYTFGEGVSSEQWVAYNSTATLLMSNAELGEGRVAFRGGRLGILPGRLPLTSAHRVKSAGLYVDGAVFVTCDNLFFGDVVAQEVSLYAGVEKGAFPVGEGSKLVAPNISILLAPISVTLPPFFLSEWTVVPVPQWGYDIVVAYRGVKGGKVGLMSAGSVFWAGLFGEASVAQTGPDSHELRIGIETSQLADIVQGEACTLLDGAYTCSFVAGVWDTVEDTGRTEPSLWTSALVRLPLPNDGIRETRQVDEPRVTECTDEGGAVVDADGDVVCAESLPGFTSADTVFCETTGCPHGTNDDCTCRLAACLQDVPYSQHPKQYVGLCDEAGDDVACLELKEGKAANSRVRTFGDVTRCEGRGVLIDGTCSVGCEQPTTMRVATWVFIGVIVYVLVCVFLLWCLLCRRPRKKTASRTAAQIGNLRPPSPPRRLADDVRTGLLDPHTHVEMIQIGGASNMESPPIPDWDKDSLGDEGDEDD